MNILTWMLSQEQNVFLLLDECKQCNDLFTQPQETSGLGTVIVILGLFLGIRIAHGGGTQRRQQKPQQLQDKWQDVVQPSEEEEAEWLQMHNDVYYDVINTDFSEENDRFEDALDT